MNTKAHRFSTVLAKKVEAHSVKNNYRCIQIHILTFQLYYTTKSNKQQLLYVLFDASELRLSSLRCGVEKSLRTTNETIFLAHINLSVSSVCQNAPYTADDATKAQRAAVRRLSFMLSVLDLGAVQIELSIWQHRFALQLCIAH